MRARQQRRRLLLGPRQLRGIRPPEHHRFQRPGSSGGLRCPGRQALSQITAGGESTCAVDTTGAAYCWGLNGAGQLGNGSGAISLTVPVKVDASGPLAGKTLTQISAGLNYTCAVDSAGTAYCWVPLASIGDGSSVGSRVPVAVDTSGALAGKTLSQITAGLDDACALDTTGAAYCWGDNAYGALGDGIPGSCQYPGPR